MSTPTNFPNVRGASGILFDAALDFVVRNGAVFVSQVEKNYRGIAVTRVDLGTMQAQIVYERVTPFNDGDPATYFTWMYPREDGMMVARAVNCPIAGFATSRCGVSFPWR